MLVYPLSLTDPLRHALIAASDEGGDPLWVTLEASQRTGWRDGVYLSRHDGSELSAAEKARVRRIAANADEINRLTWTVQVEGTRYEIVDLAPQGKDELVAFVVPRDRAGASRKPRSWTESHRAMIDEGRARIPVWRGERSAGGCRTLTSTEEVPAAALANLLGLLFARDPIKQSTRSAVEARLAAVEARPKQTAQGRQAEADARRLLAAGNVAQARLKVEIAETESDRTSLPGVAYQYRGALR
jgi:hypothetical protein